MLMCFWPRYHAVSHIPSYKCKVTMPEITLRPSSYYPFSSMVPLTRMPSFPPPAPPPSNCQHKRNFRLTHEDLEVLQLQPPADILEPDPTRDGPRFFMARPSTPFPRTPSPSLSSEVDVDII